MGVRQGRRVGDRQGKDDTIVQRGDFVRDCLARINIEILREHRPPPASHRHGEYEIAASRCKRRRSSERGRCRVIGICNNGTTVERLARHCRKLGGEFGARPCTVLQTDFVYPAIPGVLSRTVTETSGFVAEAEWHVVILRLGYRLHGDIDPVRIKVAVRDVIDKGDMSPLSESESSKSSSQRISVIPRTIDAKLLFVFRSTGLALHLDAKRPFGRGSRRASLEE